LSDYELGKLRLNAEMIVQLATALETTTDELLKPSASRSPLRRKPSLRLQRRMEKSSSCQRTSKTICSRRSTAF
jgi:hypothetical protein